jgi:hypothetical protein
VRSPRGHQLLGSKDAGLPAVRMNLAPRPPPSLPRTPRMQLQSHRATSFWKATTSSPSSSSQRVRSSLRAEEDEAGQHHAKFDRGGPVALQCATRSSGCTSDDYRRPEAPLTNAAIRTVLQPCVRPQPVYYLCPRDEWKDDGCVIYLLSVCQIEYLVLHCMPHSLVRRLLVYTGNSLQIEGRCDNYTCQLQSIRQRRFTPYMEEHLSMAPPTVRASRR